MEIELFKIRCDFSDESGCQCSSGTMLCDTIDSARREADRLGWEHWDGEEWYCPKHAGMCNDDGTLKECQKRS